MSSPFDGPDRIIFMRDGSEPPQYHVRDQEAHYASLAPCEVAPADRRALGPVRLAAFPATLWLPGVETVEPLEVPPPAGGTHWEGWEWPDGSTLIVDVSRDAPLPRLHSIGGTRPEARGAAMGRRPVAVDRRDPDETGDEFRAWVEGFLADTARVIVMIAAPSAAARDRLVAAALTLTPDAAAEPRHAE